MHFYCTGGAGHAHVEATFNAGSEVAGTIQTALLSMPLEAAAIDAFVQQLYVMGAKRVSRAVMVGKD